MLSFISLYILQTSKSVFEKSFAQIPKHKNQLGFDESTKYQDTCFESKLSLGALEFVQTVFQTHYV